MQQMGVVARAFRVRELEMGERFVEQLAPRCEGAFDGREQRAVEIVKAEDQVEGGLGELEGFQVRFNQHDALDVRGDGGGSAAVDGDAARIGQRGGPVESR